ncbi:Protein of uncharacterised function (DUF2789) [Moraxella caprae]|uniref:Protein of uncharacterized function (DUF2789) n=1 Tax=Moraxella caprae TaxID=90240 RepID=A0A378R379_9GAMM|nr:DUF2789 family protein [Moraxella caprae]STZ09654.1 Protein of uncharacterised function (DUF2789) [Moraxella caprae]
MLDNAEHTMNDLFTQLGLPNSDSEIDAFIKNNQLPENVTLADAPFLDEQQSMFIREEWKLDAVWSLVIDELNARLHEENKPA